MMGKVVDDADEDGTEEEEEAAHEEQVRCKLAQLDKRDGGHSLRSAAASDAEKPTEPFEAALQETRQLLTSSRKRKLEATQATDERHQRHRHKQVFICLPFTSFGRKVGENLFWVIKK